MSEASAVHSVFVPIRWSDFDRYGHLMNANYIELAQEARMQFARDHIYPEFPLFAAYVRHLDVDYSAPIKPEGIRELEIDTWTTKVGNTSFTTHQEIRAPRGPIACVVRCVQVAVDVDSGMPRALTDREKEILTKTVLDD